MADPFVAEIRIFPFNFAPFGWAVCDGQLLPISQNTALFSLLGTTYGGDGKSTFGLPNLQGQAPMFWGQGPGLSLYDIGQSSGSDTVSLLESEIPAHAHAVIASQGDAFEQAPNNSALASGVAIGLYAAPGPLVSLDDDVHTPAGGDQPHNNLMPYLTLNFCIAMQGVFPPRT